MARKFVILALLLVAIVGLASAQEPTSAPDTSSSAMASSPDTIGAVDDDGAAAGDDAVEAPVGGTIPPGAFPPTEAGPAAAPTGSSATMVKFSAAGMILAVAGYFI